MLCLFLTKKGYDPHCTFSVIFPASFIPFIFTTFNQHLDKGLSFWLIDIIVILKTILNENSVNNRLKSLLWIGLSEWLQSPFISRTQTVIELYYPGHTPEVFCWKRAVHSRDSLRN